RERRDQGDEDARLGRRARAGGKHRRGGFEAEHVGHSKGVVAIHYRLLSQLAEVLHQVVGEGVVVVEDEEHGIMYSVMEWLAAQVQALLAGVDEFSRWLVGAADGKRSEEHTSELQSRGHLVCRLLLEKKKMNRRRSQLCLG